MIQIEIISLQLFTPKKLIKASSLIDKNEFLNEAKFLNKCNHSNLIKVYGISMKINDLDSIIMEYMNLGDLRAYLKQCRNSNVIKENF